MNGNNKNFSGDSKMNIEEEYRDVYENNGFGVDHESGREVLFYVAYVNGQEIGAFEDEQDAADALALH
jgi:hypothetical protein